MDLKSKDKIKSSKLTDRSNSNDLDAFITDPQTMPKLGSISNYKETFSPPKLSGSKGIDA